KWTTFSPPLTPMAPVTLETKSRGRGDFALRIAAEVTVAIPGCCWRHKLHRVSFRAPDFGARTLLFCELPSPVYNPGHQLRDAGAPRVEKRVPHGSPAAGDENLVHFVRRGVKRGNQDRQKSPAPLPPLFGRSDGAKQQHTKNKIFAHMNAFAEENVQR